MKPIKNFQLGLFHYSLIERRLVFGVSFATPPIPDSERGRIDEDEVDKLKQALSTRGASEIAQEEVKEVKKEEKKFLEQHDLSQFEGRVEGRVEVSPEKMQEAIRKGQHELLAYLTKRAGRLPKNMDTVMSPMDETRFFRLGEGGSRVGYGLSANSLARLGKELLDQGFPRINREEIDLVLFSRLKSFKEARPDMRIVGQHFPRENTGASTLEATEYQPVHIKDVDVETFKEGMKSGLMDDIMISHASYEYDEGHFPGIDKIKKDIDLHPLLQDVDSNSLPASLNPLMIRYLREEMGHKGLIIPDWYDMGAIKQFLEKKERSDPEGEQLNVKKLKEIFENDYLFASAIILGVDAGASFITGVPHRMGFDIGWEKLKETSPEIYTRLEEKLNKTIEETFKIIKPKNSDVQLNAKELTFEEKILFMTYNKKHNQNEYKNFLKTMFTNKEAFKILIDHGTGDYDVWNRTGVMTLILRQKIIEQLTGEKFDEPPQKIDEEKEWFTNLMNNPRFKSYYDGIDWDSPQMKDMYSEIKQEIAEPPMLLASAA